MKIWISSEATGEVGDDIGRLSNLTEVIVNEELASIDFKIDDVDMWAVITILLPEGHGAYNAYCEVQKFHKKRKVLEYRLRIDYQAFLNSDDLGKVQLFFDMLLRSVDAMVAKKIPKIKIDILKEVCLKSAEKVKAKILEEKIDTL